MEQGKYSILLGKFERFSVLPAQPGSGDGSAQISLVDVKVALRSIAVPFAFFFVVSIPCSLAQCRRLFCIISVSACLSTPSSSRSSGPVPATPRARRRPVTASLPRAAAQVTAAPEAFERCQMPERYLQPADSGKLAVTFRLQVPARLRRRAPRRASRHPPPRPLSARERSVGCSLDCVLGCTALFSIGGSVRCCFSMSLSEECLLFLFCGG